MKKILITITTKDCIVYVIVHSQTLKMIVMKMTKWSNVLCVRIGFITR